MKSTHKRTKIPVGPKGHLPSSRSPRFVLLVHLPCSFMYFPCRTGNFLAICLAILICCSKKNWSSSTSHNDYGDAATCYLRVAQRNAPLATYFATTWAISQWKFDFPALVSSSRAITITAPRPQFRGRLREHTTISREFVSQRRNKISRQVADRKLPSITRR